MNTETRSQVTRCSKTFDAGSLRQIRGKITTLRVVLTMMEPLHGSSKATLSPNGNHQVPFCGSVGSVRVSHIYSLTRD